MYHGGGRAHWGHAGGEEERANGPTEEPRGVMENKGGGFQRSGVRLQDS